MSVLIGYFFRYETKAASYAKYMSIDRKDRAITGEEQCAGDSLRAYAFERGEKLFCFVERRGEKKREIERLASLIDFIEQILDSHRLLASETA